jgi:hypothetical protein
MLLLNVTSPQDIVAEMTRLARPGGVVALQEPDSAAWATDPPHPAWELLLTEVTDVYPRTGRDFHTGRRAARLLRDAGLRDVQVRVLARLTAPGQYFHTFLLTLAVLMREDILAAGRLTPGQLDSCTAELGEHLSQPGTLTCLPTIWQAWGRKPHQPGTNLGLASRRIPGRFRSWRRYRKAPPKYAAPTAHNRTI